MRISLSWLTEKGELMNYMFPQANSPAHRAGSALKILVQCQLCLFMQGWIFTNAND